VTVADAAERLGITKEAVRKRVSRRTLRSDKDPDGTVRVYIPPSGTSSGTASEAIGRDDLVELLRAQLEDLRTDRDAWRDQARRSDYMASAAMDRTRELESRIRQLEAPSEARESPEPVEEDPERVEPHSATGGAQESAERPQQLSEWLAPVDKLPWWHYVIGISLVFLAEATRSILWSHLPVGFLSLVSLLGFLMQTYLPPGIFGLWVGYRRRDPRFLSQTIPFGALIGIVVWLGYNFGLAIDRFNATGLVDALVVEMKYFFPQDLIYVGCAAWLFYVSAYLIGHARQRQRTGRISGTTPASPVSRAAQGPAQRPRKDLTPAQQAILGWGGAIISAVITLVGTIISTRSGP